MEKSYLALLGLKARDKVTGMEGVVSSVSFDLYGCVQVILTPGVNDKDGKIGDSFWCDWKRLQILGKKPIMPVPHYENGPGSEIGAAEKPVR